MRHTVFLTPLLQSLLSVNPPLGATRLWVNRRLLGDPFTTAIAIDTTGTHVDNHGRGFVPSNNFTEFAHAAVDRPAPRWWRQKINQFSGDGQSFEGCCIIKIPQNWLDAKTA